MSNEIKEILIKAREIISKPENWTKGYFARNQKGATVREDDKNAISFCAVGALIKASVDICGADYYNNYFKAKGKVNINLHGEGLMKFNDKGKTTHADVLNLFDRAIENEN